VLARGRLGSDLKTRVRNRSSDLLGNRIIVSALRSDMVFATIREGVLAVRSLEVDGAVVRTMETPAGMERFSDCIILAPTSWMAVQHECSSWSVWDTETGALRFRENSKERVSLKTLCPCQFSSDSEYVAFGW